MVAAGLDCTGRGSQRLAHVGSLGSEDGMESTLWEARVIRGHLTAQTIIALITTTEAGQIPVL